MAINCYPKHGYKKKDSENDLKRMAELDGKISNDVRS